MKKSILLLGLSILTACQDYDVSLNLAEPPQALGLTAGKYAGSANIKKKNIVELKLRKLTQFGGIDRTQAEKKLEIALDQEIGKLALGNEADYTGSIASAGLSLTAHRSYQRQLLAKVDRNTECTYQVEDGEECGREWVEGRERRRCATDSHGNEDPHDCETYYDPGHYDIVCHTRYRDVAGTQYLDYETYANVDQVVINFGGADNQLEMKNLTKQKTNYLSKHERSCH
jgi:hypothetical protein